MLHHGACHRAPPVQTGSGRRWTAGHRKIGTRGPDALRRDSGLPGGLDHSTWCPVHPAVPEEYTPEVYSSDNRRIFAFTDKGIYHALRVSQKTCLAGGGAVDRAKLQAFCLKAGQDAVRYSRATADTALGALTTCVSGLAMVKTPIVMCERPVDVLEKYKEALRHLGRALPRTAPTYALALRVVADFALAKAEFVFDAVPVEGIDVTDIQRLSDAFHRRALGFPRSFSQVVLYRPLDRLGLEVPRPEACSSVCPHHRVSHEQPERICVPSTVPCPSAD